MGNPSEPTPPFVVLGGRWRRRATLALGYAAAAVMPRRTQAIEQGQAGDQLSPADRLIVGALVHRALTRHQPLDHLAYLHQQMWAGDTITTYHANVEDRFARWFLPHQAVVIDALVSDLSRQTAGALHTLCEIGTGTGITLDWLAKRLGKHGITRSIGLDLSPAQVATNRTRFPGLVFIHADATHWIPTNAGSGWVFFCCGGVLEYFTRQNLVALMAATARWSPVRWVVVEPVDHAHAVESDAQSHIAGFERTWSHPYPLVFAEAGLRETYRQDLRFDNMRWHLGIATA